MSKVDVDRKLILFEAIRDSLLEVDVSTDDVAAFEFAYDGMYEMERLADSGVEIHQTDTLGLIGEQLADATAIAVAFSVGKFFLSMMIDPILEKKVLPCLDRYEEELIERTGQLRLVKSVRKHIERTIRNHLEMPPES